MVKESVCNAGDPASIPGSERPPGEGNGNPLQYSCLEKSMDRGTSGVQSMGLHKVGQTEQLTFSLSLSMFM